MGGIFEPFLESSTPKQSAPPALKPLSSLTVKDVLPSDEQLQLILQHKETTLDIEKQKEIVNAILKEAPNDELLKMAPASELSALGNIVIRGSRDGTLAALALYKAAMEGGDDRGAFSYATMLHRQAMSNNKTDPQALEILSNLARKGHPYAQMNLAAIIMRNQPDQVSSALKLYELAAKSGIDKAYVELGRMYRIGYGVHQDHEKAYRYFEQGAKRGDAQCNFMLGVYHSSQTGVVDENQEKAFKYFQKAAMRGLPEAQYNVGFRFLQGHGVERNSYNAAEFLRMAAMQGFQLAQINLAAMYMHGDGVKKNTNEARHWLEKAAALGGKMGQDAQKRLASLDNAGHDKGGSACNIM
ncbi:HCP-like protein [Lichtheimia hyalospora FSU 10163]|nr:HCP-like protein [Lichtheimia hyalospora FSU 10163]